MRLFAIALLLCATGLAQNASQRDTVWYDAGTRDLDSHRYEDAVRNFDRVIGVKGTRADGALYWKAYALNRLGRRDAALAAIASLRRDFPSSRWLGDAQALEVETKPVAPGDESNEDLKLMAINSLMNADPSRAVPLLEGVLKGSASPRLKDRAMFVLTQSHSPEAQQVLANYAKGSANPDLQRRAIRYIGMGGTQGTRQQLMDIYAAATDVDVKREILRSLAMSGGSAAVLDIAASEKNRTLRIEAIRDLSMTKTLPPESLMKLYSSESDPEVKREILNALFIRGDAKDLVELARKETDPAMKKTIVERLSTMRNNKDATDYMMELLK